MIPSEGASPTSTTTFKYLKPTVCTMANESVIATVQNSESVGSFMTALESIYSRILLALLILLLGFILGKLVERILYRVLHGLELNKSVKALVGTRLMVEEFLSHLTEYAIYFVAIVMALEVMRLSSIIVYILSAGLILIIVASILLGLKDLIPNAMAGLMLHRKNFVNEGDTIKLEDIEGTIIDCNLLDVRVKQKNGDIMLIPNVLFIKKEWVKKKGAVNNG